MSSPLRASTLRLGLGGIALLMGLGIAFFLLPDASQTLDQKRKAREEADRTLKSQKQQLTDLQSEVDRLQRDREIMANIESHMPKGSAGELQWQLSRTLHELAAKHGVRLQNLKYGLASREGTKGTELEALDVQFVALGVYTNIKAFMLAVEGSNLPFAVRDGRLDESPEGAKLDITLRAFRRSGKAEKEDET
jgi:Tfp pilus assembly protein PilO